MNIEQGLVNVLVEHHPNIGDIISNRYLKKLVMFKIPKMGHLPSPAIVLFVTLQNPPRRRDVLNTHAAQLGLHRFNILPWNSDPKIVVNDSSICLGFPYIIYIYYTYIHIYIYN
jgi:hypothetical protein